MPILSIETIRDTLNEYDKGGGICITILIPYLTISFLMYTTVHYGPFTNTCREGGGLMQKGGGH